MCSQLAQSKQSMSHNKACKCRYSAAGSCGSCVFPQSAAQCIPVVSPQHFHDSAVQLSDPNPAIQGSLETPFSSMYTKKNNNYIDEARPKNRQGKQIQEPIRWANIVHKDSMYTKIWGSHKEGYVLGACVAEQVVQVAHMRELCNSKVLFYVIYQLQGFFCYIGC